MIPNRFQGAERFGDVPEARREACPRGTESLGATKEMGCDPEQGDEDRGDRADGRWLVSHDGLSPPAPFGQDISPCPLLAASPGCGICMALKRSCPAVPQVSSLHQPEPGAEGPSSIPSSHGGLDHGLDLAGNFD